LDLQDTEYQASAAEFLGASPHFASKRGEYWSIAECVVSASRQFKSEISMNNRKALWRERQFYEKEGNRKGASVRRMTGEVTHF
jgi:hypothetical protein